MKRKGWTRLTTKSVHVIRKPRTLEEREFVERGFASSCAGHFSPRHFLGEICIQSWTQRTQDLYTRLCAKLSALQASACFVRYTIVTIKVLRECLFRCRLGSHLNGGSYATVLGSSGDGFGVSFTWNDRSVPTRNEQRRFIPIHELRWRRRLHRRRPGRIAVGRTAMD